MREADALYKNAQRAKLCRCDALAQKRKSVYDTIIRMPRTWLGFRMQDAINHSGVLRFL